MYRIVLYRILPYYCTTTSYHKKVVTVVPWQRYHASLGQDQGLGTNQPGHGLQQRHLFGKDEFCLRRLLLLRVGRPQLNLTKPEPKPKPPKPRAN